mmetsp:Transcript_4894/g.7275  ORF Transcript_4894/g.7275 Transcript_4894/m.7275 type:complete len:167 (+) Transcript_4894:94-594(+)
MSTITWVVFLFTLLFLISLQADRESNDFLTAHNTYRQAVNIPTLTWSSSLATDAQNWADFLTTNLEFKHDSNNNNEGENLWMSTSFTYSHTQMVDDWGAESQYFIHGIFPNDVSTTGNWEDVGHYTQLVWKNTSEVGCAGSDGSDGNYRLVCRYSPPGNVVGQQVF